MLPKPTEQQQHLINEHLVPHILGGVISPLMLHPFGFILRLDETNKEVTLLANPSNKVTVNMKKLATDIFTNLSFFLSQTTPSLRTPNVLRFIPSYSSFVVRVFIFLYRSSSLLLVTRRDNYRNWRYALEDEILYYGIWYVLHGVEASLLNQVAWLALLGGGSIGAVIYVFVESFLEHFID
uniref:Uncharacterized protein n=1 Tax=Glossina austeni TaxID=7395 RepID=A0A1A9UNY2_GLOAU